MTSVFGGFRIPDGKTPPKVEDFFLDPNAAPPAVSETGDDFGDDDGMGDPFKD